MRKFYDNQVEEKRLMRAQEHQNDRQLGQMITNKIETINKLTDLDNTKRMLARG